VAVGAGMYARPDGETAPGGCCGAVRGCRAGVGAKRVVGWGSGDAVGGSNGAAECRPDGHLLAAHRKGRSGGPRFAVPADVGVRRSVRSRPLFWRVQSPFAWWRGNRG